MSWTFWSTIDVSGEDDCWEWQGFKNPDGYGKTYWSGEHWYAHRLAYFMETGEQPGEVVMHTCDTPECCNPGHLVSTEQGDNAQDMVRKGRHAGKLVAAHVREIRSMLASGEYNQKQIADIFGVDQATISHISTGRTWSCV
ncbi:MAG: hypothetical protein BWY85_00451 [Firmicutes bacterium ADurb.Bin506]|nr:MAG: hypothetical protein BWY85_00451 [Firmicutes bacterium ADurb.Bin506]